MRRKVTLACVAGLLAALGAAGGLSAARATKSSPAADQLPPTITIGATSEKTGPVPVLLERDQSIPPLDVLLAEVRRLEQVYERAVARAKVA